MISMQTNGTYVTHSYDALGNLLTVQFSNGTKVDYLVDGSDRRVQRRLNNTFSAAFIYQDQLKPIAQLNSNGSIKSLFIYGSKHNVPDLMVQSGVTYRIISDHLGSPLYVVRASNGLVVQSMSYDTWGNVLSDSNPGFQPFGFAGGLYDATTGLVRFGARDYDPSIGRWLNKDPIRFEGGWNLYAYVGNDPVNYIDPTGKILLNSVTAIAGAISGGVGGYITSGTLSGTLIGAAVGGALGAFNPIGVLVEVGPLAGALVGSGFNGASSAVGQMAGNLISGKDADCNFSAGAVLGAMIGAGLGGCKDSHQSKMPFLKEDWAGFLKDWGLQVTQIILIGETQK
jgi:RHS repeat-associated protein